MGGSRLCLPRTALLASGDVLAPRLTRRVAYARISRSIASSTAHACCVSLVCLLVALFVVSLVCELFDALGEVVQGVLVACPDATVLSRVLAPLVPCG